MVRKGWLRGQTGHLEVVGAEVVEDALDQAEERRQEACAHEVLAELVRLARGCAGEAGEGEGPRGARAEDEGEIEGGDEGGLVGALGEDEDDCTVDVELEALRAGVVIDGADVAEQVYGVDLPSRLASQVGIN